MSTISLWKLEFYYKIFLYIKLACAFRLCLCEFLTWDHKHINMLLMKYKIHAVFVKGIYVYNIYDLQVCLCTKSQLYRKVI